MAICVGRTEVARKPPIVQHPVVSPEIHTVRMPSCIVHSTMFLAFSIEICQLLARVTWSTAPKTDWCHSNDLNSLTRSVFHVGGNLSGCWVTRHLLPEWSQGTRWLASPDQFCQTLLTGGAFAPRLLQLTPGAVPVCSGIVDTQPLPSVLSSWHSKCLLHDGDHLWYPQPCHTQCGTS